MGLSLIPLRDTASVLQPPILSPTMAMVGENSLIGIYYAPDEYGLFYEGLIMKIAMCESSCDPTKINWNDKGSPSYGLLQFKKPTFEAYCWGDIMNPEHQKECMNEMLLEDFDNIYNWANCWYRIQ